MTVFEAAEFLRGHDKFLILTHTRPDGDTVGCAAGLCRALRDSGKIAYILPNPEVSSLFAPYLEGLTCGADYAPDTVVCVDLAASTMFPVNVGDYAQRVDLTIDHHGSQEFYAKHTVLDASCAACGEIIYEIVKLLGPVTAEIATPLYVAVSTDCGGFIYGNTTANTHRVAAELIACGIDLPALNKLHFRTKSFVRMKLESAILSDMELYDDGAVAIASIPLALMDSLGATKADIEDIAALVGAVEGVKVSATLRELTANECKISLRTDPNYLNASTTCALLGGGGHAAAAGATAKLSLADTKRVILDAIRQVRHGN
ncbi:MAG: DHH family phosphoesterase [Clostridia bacterium]|nr:DHH family phosphoesterase [Clostridia bacterium]